MALVGPGHSVAEQFAQEAALQREQDAVLVSPSRQTRVLPLPLGGVGGKRGSIDFDSSVGISCCGTESPGWHSSPEMELLSPVAAPRTLEEKFPAFCSE